MHGDALDDAGVVDEDVNLADLSVDFLDESLDVVFLRNVADIAVNVLDAGLLIVGQSALKGCFVDVVEDDVLDAGCNKRLGDVESDAVGSACNPSVFSFQ